MFILLRRNLLQCNSSISRRVFISALLIKILAAFGVGVLYDDYYLKGDTMVLFENTFFLSNIFFNNPLEYIQSIFSDVSSQVPVRMDMRSINFAKLSSFIALFSLSNYWVTAVITSILTFLASWYLVSAIERSFKSKSYIYASYVSFLFIPSIVFWTSGFLKETLVSGCIYILAGVVFKYSKKVAIHALDYTLFLICAFVLVLVKYYIAAILLPILVIWILYESLKSKNYLSEHPWKTCSIVSLTVILTAFLGTRLHPNLNPKYFDKVIQWNYRSSIEAGGDIEYHHIESGYLGILQDTPAAMVTGVLRPFIWESRGNLQIIAGIENLMILLTFIALIIVIIKNNPKVDSVLVWILIYAIVANVLISLTTTNFGTLIRYRTAYLPFLIFVALIPLMSFFFQRIANKN